MRTFLFLMAGLAAATSQAAGAACRPALVEGSNVVTLRPMGSFDNQQLNGHFEVRVRNDGDEACTLRLGVGRELGGTGGAFPAYSLSGPGGSQTVSALSAVGDPPAFGAEFVVPANTQTALSYNVQMAVGWGSEAGTFIENLVVELFDAGSTDAVARQRTQLRLEIPRTSRIRFAGAGGADGPARIEMGSISPTAATHSPPFAIRVLSTSPYRVDLTSQNQGALRRLNGPDLIPYRMTFGGSVMNLGGVGDHLSVLRHTTAAGDVHPLSIAIQPDPTYHAGTYEDRVTVTVTPL